MVIGSLRYHAASRLLKGLALAALTAGAGWAAGVDQAAMFAGYVASPSYRSILEKAYNDTEPALLKGQCKVLKLTAFDPPENVVPVQFVNRGGSWQTADGIWAQRATLDRCGTPVQRSVLVETGAKNTLRTSGLLPGAYGAGYKFEEKARETAVNTLLGLMGCQDWRNAVVLDTALKTKLKAGSGWTELWTIAMCGKTVKARVDYSPRSANDMEIVASLAAAR